MVPVVSVVMAVYNGEKYLRESIESVLNQRLRDFEFIVIDDGSTDASWEIINSYNDRRIRSFWHPNCGLAASLNAGIQRARAEYIARMDADDISLPNRLQIQFEFLERHHEILAVGSAAEVIDEGGEYVCILQKPAAYDQLKKQLPDTPFIHPSVMFRRLAFYEAGKYPAWLKGGGEDAVLFNRMARLGVVRNLSEPLIRYRVHPSAVSRKSKSFERMLNSIVERAIQGHVIPQSEIACLDATGGKLSVEQKLLEYHVLLAKKLLWNNPSGKQARYHLMQAFALDFWNFQIWLLLVVSFLPGEVARICYDAVRRARNAR